MTASLDSAAQVNAVTASIGEFNAVPVLAGVGLPPGLTGLGIAPEGTDSYPWCYWRRVDGTIVIGQTTPVEYLKQMRKKMVCLERYGRFFLNTKGGPYNTHRGYDFLLRAGGAREFFPAQIVELGWHRDPPKVADAAGVMHTIDFPQMQGITVYEVQCPTCQKRFANLDEATPRLRLRNHESVVHRDTSTQTELGRIISDATSGTMAPVNTQMAEALKAIGQALTGLADRQQAQDERFAALLERLAPATSATAAT